MFSPAVNVFIKTVFKEVYKIFVYGTDSLAGKETFMYPTVYYSERLSGLVNALKTIRD